MASFSEKYHAFSCLEGAHPVAALFEIAHHPSGDTLPRKSFAYVTFRYINRLIFV
ncbi:MAG: hypothetical protein F6K10_23495 [Moorea sp. SIO2B7]|nr:hypothetical protein [Moorena sp. SIO2B7]